MFFYVTLRSKGGGVILISPANSETKEARTMKFCTVKVYYINSITKQLKFINFHCSVVCSYYSVVCLIPKRELKMIKFSSSFKLNEIHIVDSPFIEDLIFSREALISGEGRAENGQ